MRTTTLLGLALLAAGLPAQSFYVPANTLPSAGTGNVFPFNTSTMRYQALILASDLGSTPAVIKSFGLAPSVSGVKTYPSVTMKMAHLAASTLSTTFDQNLAAGAVTTMDVTNWTWPMTGGVWNDVDLQVPFTYNGVDNLVVEFLVVQGTGSGGTMYRENTNQRVYLGSYSGQLTGSNGGNTAFKMRVNLGDATFAAFGSGCPGTNSLTPALTFAGSCQLGQTLGHQLANAVPSGVGFLSLGFWFGPPFPLDLGVYGFPGCTLYFPSATTLVAIADPLGAAVVNTPVPNLPGLVGLVLYSQWLVLDATNATLAVSNYGRFQTGL